MTATEQLERAREACRERRWGLAHQSLAALGRETSLDPDDLERLAIAAHLIGHERESIDALAQGYRGSLGRHEPRRAAWFAFWVSQGFFFSGDESQASGWLARARSLLEGEPDCVEAGCLLVPEGIDRLLAGDPAGALVLFDDALARARRHGDADLLSMALHGRGRALIRLGRVGEGMRALDELMALVTGGDDLTPLIHGRVYCGLLEACREVFDIRRAREWTAAMRRWCDEAPDLMPYRGPCLVYRAEVMRLQGAWDDAFVEAQRACDWLSQPESPETAADAFYQLGESHRLRGEFEAAEAAYTQASRLGRRPQPGLALVWLAHGRVGPATAALRRELDESHDAPGARPALLAAHVEALLAAGDAVAARGGADELRALADAYHAPLLDVLAEMADGAVSLAEGRPEAAITALREAWSVAHRIDAPYEAARARVLGGLAYRQMADEQLAIMEIDAAIWAFEQLGATFDRQRAEDLLRTGGPGLGAPGGLTLREVDVLRLVAAGRTNREIGSALVISEHTVARHVQNMLAKLDLPSRAALATYAVSHGLSPAAAPGQD